MSYPYDPDYVVAPGETLREWLTYTGLGTTRIAAAAFAVDEREHVQMLLDQVLGGLPLLEEHAYVLGHLPTAPGTGFWLALEHNYRTGLAAGKRDMYDRPTEG